MASVDFDQQILTLNNEWKTVTSEGGDKVFLHSATRGRALDRLMQVYKSTIALCSNNVETVKQS